jgi:hypothetical protein
MHPLVQGPSTATGIQQVWQRVYAWMGTHISSREIGKQHFILFGNLFKSNKGKKIRHLIWLATTWSIWRMRNNIMFRGDIGNFTRLFDNIIKISWL